MDILMKQKLKVINLALELSGWAPLVEDEIVTIIRDSVDKLNDPVPYKVTFKVPITKSARCPTDTRTVKVDAMAFACGQKCVEVS